MIQSSARAERLFSGQISQEYEILKLICPAAAEMSARVGDFVASVPNETGAPLRAFEIGCGTGVTTKALLEARDDVTVTAIDNEPAMLAQARANLPEFVDAGRLRLVEADALSALREVPARSLDIVASAYAIHNFLDDYRTLVLGEIFRVLRPGGVFVNGDRYGLDDSLEHTRLTQSEVRRYFEVLMPLGRHDLLEQWVLHHFSDDSSDRLMRLGPALARMQQVGFEAIEVRYRDGVNTLLTATTPRV